MKKVYTNELEKMVGKEVTLSGWVHDVRILGGLNFVLLRDMKGVAQIKIAKGEVEEKLLEVVKKLHQEDVIVVKGKVVKSRVKGVEIIPKEIDVMKKSEVPLPLDPRCVTPATLPTKLNWRFLYFRTEEARSIFRIQGEIVNSFREFCRKKGYVEIQPPVIISSSTEGGADLFEVKYFDKKAFLAQSPQIYKQMCAMAFEKVFTVLPVFRAEKFDQPTHLNEIRQMDVEEAFVDYEEAMNVLEECLVFIISNVAKRCEEELEFLGRRIKVPRRPFKRITYDEMIEILRRNGEKIEWGEDLSKTQERKLGKLVGDVFFVKDWPLELKPFYAMPLDEKKSKSFDLIYHGLEISSGTERINDPELLVKRLKEKGLDPKNFKYYIDVFRYGAPLHSGWSIGLERLTMVVTGKNNIREVTMFPRDMNRLTP